jgi:hypothetical protein
MGVNIERLLGPLTEEETLQLFTGVMDNLSVEHVVAALIELYQDDDLAEIVASLEAELDRRG